MSILNNIVPGWLVNNSSTSKINPPLISNGTTTFTIPIPTKEEEVELKTLEEQHQTKIKIAKIARFKSQESNIRQHIIDSIKAQAIVDDINYLTVVESDRLVELKYKIRNSMLHGSLGNWNDTMRLSNPITINDFSLEELEKAHLEQCMEEEVLNGK